MAAKLSHKEGMCSLHTQDLMTEPSLCTTGGMMATSSTPSISSQHGTPKRRETFASMLFVIRQIQTWSQYTTTMTRSTSSTHFTWTIHGKTKK